MNKFRLVNRSDSITIFNPLTGETIIDGSGICDTPFLLDVSLTNKCSFNCQYCYKHSHPNGDEMSFSDFELLIRKMQEAHIFQVAYGGGNPNEHPFFIEILKMTYEAGIVPNYSTNGSNLTESIIEATGKYCGAVAVSIHNRINTYASLIQKLTSVIKKVNVHFVMTKNKMDEIVNFLENPPEWANNINAVVLLRYKHVFNSKDQEPDETDYKSIFSSAEKSRFKIAFDACSFPLIQKFLPSVDKSLYDYCQGGRSTAYISEKLIMSPCSFDLSVDEDNDLHNHSIKQIFTESGLFKKRREEILERKICKQYFRLI